MTTATLLLPLPATTAAAGHTTTTVAVVVGASMHAANNSRHNTGKYTTCTFSWVHSR